MQGKRVEWGARELRGPRLTARQEAPCASTEFRRAFVQYIDTSGDPSKWGAAVSEQEQRPKEGGAQT